MRIAQVIGSLTLSRWHPSLEGASFRLVRPLTLAELASGAAPQAEELVTLDERGAAIGQRIALSEGGEAAQPFHPNLKPIDAYAAAILDTIEVTPLG